MNQIGSSHAALPKNLSPQSTVHDHFKLFDWDGTLECTHHALYVAVREQAGRETSPSAAIIDSQSAKTAQSLDEPARLRCGQEGRSRQVIIIASFGASNRPARPSRRHQLSQLGMWWGFAMACKLKFSELHHDGIRHD